MSHAPADQVNAVELAGRRARLERESGLSQLPRLVEAGALAGTRVHALLGFATFEGRVTLEARVEGVIVLPCQRCMRPCECAIDESALLAVVAGDAEELPGGYEALLGDAERLSLGELVEEQVLLGMPLVPMHENAGQCGVGAAEQAAVDAGSEETQRPFANLRQLLDEGER
jgi:uncharacterized protein